MKTLALTAALAAALILVPAAAAKPVRYSGTTNAGDRIGFVVNGGKVSAIRTFTPTSCVPTGGTPRAGTDFFEPPGAFPIGRTTKVQTPEPVESAMHYDKVSKWFHVTLTRGKRGAISGKLHQNYAFESLTSDSWSGVGLIGWVCQGDARFTARSQ
jgi:hypothetical protein